MGRNQTGEKQKENILLPYTLEVVEILREIERYVRGRYMETKNSMDLKSLDPQQDIEIIIEIEIEEKEKGKEETNEDGKKDNCFGKILKKVKAHSTLENVGREVGNKKDLNTMIVLLILARILGYDGKYLWNDIYDFIEYNKNGEKKIDSQSLNKYKPYIQPECDCVEDENNGKEAKKERHEKNRIDSQPFYKFRYYDPQKIGLVIKDYIVIPKDFVAAYFGYDTGIDGLNLLMYGGFLLPPDRSAYISVSGEAGIGKTALAVRLITAFFQNYNFKNVHSPYEEGEIKKINKDDARPLSIHYILMEQHEKNIIRLIKECQLIDEENKNVKPILENENEEKITEKVIRKIINFEKSDMFSPMGLIEKVESIENPGDEQDKKQRKIIIIDSVNAIQEMDIKRTEWRELFQSIKAITRNGNTIVFFIVEKKSEEADFVIEYLSDVVIKLYRDYKEEAFYRVFELVESRFQTTISGKHNFYITKPDSGFIRVYPSTTAMGELLPHRKRVKPTDRVEKGNRKEVGIKIDGIIHFFKYSHLLRTKMEPFFQKNSISMFIGDRGAHKSAFAKKFALSAFRDECGETPTGYIVEIDYREQEPNKPLEELLAIGFWNATPREKSISLLLYFSENYDEDPEKDIIWETYFGKVIIPGCKGEGKNYIGHISHIVCLYEVKDYTEDVYIYQLDELIRAIESCEAKDEIRGKAKDEIPGSYYDFINQKTISLISRKTQNSDEPDSIHFNPFNILYEGDYIKNIRIDRELIQRFIKQEIRFMNFQKNDIKAKKIEELLKYLGNQEKIENISEQAAKLKRNPIIEYYDSINTTVKDIHEIIRTMSLSPKKLKLFKSNLEKIYSSEGRLTKKEKERFSETIEFISKIKKKKGDLHKLLNYALSHNLINASLEILSNKREEKNLRKLIRSTLDIPDIEIEEELTKLHHSILESLDCLDPEKEKKVLMRDLKTALNELGIAKRQDELKKLVAFDLNKIIVEISKELNRAINELLEKFKEVRKTFSNRAGVPKVMISIEEQIHRIDFLRRMIILKASYFPLDPEAPVNPEIEKHLENFYNGKVVKRLRDFNDKHEKNLFNMELLDLYKIRVNGKKKFKKNAFDYKNVDKVKISRIILDDAENLDKVYKALNPPKYISTLAHLCLAKEITLGIVNTRSKDETSEVDTVCNAVSDNAFQFDKIFFKGEMYTTFSIIRSATSFHNNMMYYLSKRDDGLLQLNNTFALLSGIDIRKPELIEIHLFLPDLSNEFSKSMYRILLNRDRILNKIQKDDKTNENKDGIKHFARRIDYASGFKVIDEKELETIYNPQERFPSIYKEWYDFLKDMITYSLAHPKVEVFTANDPFTDISIILDDESAKDAISILCLPGYLMDLYEKNLASISDYVHFRGTEDHLPVWTHLKDEEKWIIFAKNNKGEVKLGNDFYYLHKAALRVPDIPGNSDEGEKNSKDTWKHYWIVPEILFNPAIARHEDTNRVIINEYKNAPYMDIKGYPYYIDPRVNLVFSTKEKVERDSQRNEESKPDYFVHNDAHDFVALFFELWFEKVIIDIPKDNKEKCKRLHDTRSCKAHCYFCFFEQAKVENRQYIRELVIDFLRHVKRSVFFNREGLAENIYRLFKNNDESGEKEIVLREWYSSAQQKLKVIEPLLINLGEKIHVRLEIPQYFLYTTWYLAIPVNSPRKDMASEIIIKMTEPHDLAHHQISGIGLQLDERFYDKDMKKFYPEYEYLKVLNAMKNLIEYEEKDEEGSENKEEPVGIPIASNHCYFENLTLLGGFLGDFYRYYKSSVSTDKNFKKEVIDEVIDEKETEDRKNIDQLTDKLIKFSENFKNWQRADKKRCESCYMTYLLCQYKKRIDEAKGKGKGEK